MQRSAPFLFPYKSWRNSLQNRGGAPKVLTTEAVMALKNMGISTILFFAFVFTACGENSENRISNANQSPHENINYAENTYKTYDGLLSESPCGLSLNLTIAHVSSTNEDYRCSQSAPSGLWSWEPYYGGNGYVTDSDGRVYETFVDSRDGRVYKKVNIGTQTWMAENLNFVTEQSHCFKGYSGFEDCGGKEIGRYYTWPDAMDSAGVYSKDGFGCGYLPNYQAEKCAAVMSQNTVRGICPQGWHLPDTTEWNTLLNYVGNPPVKLVQRELAYFKGATDSYGFSAIPTGYWSNGSCNDCYADLSGDYIYFWASTPFVYDKSMDKSYYEFQFSGSSISSNWSKITHFNRGPSVVSYAIPVRCIMDKDNGVTNEIYASSSSTVMGDSIGTTTSSSSTGTMLSSSSRNVIKSKFTDFRNRQKYNTVTIGNQTWMAENLNYRTHGSHCYDTDNQEVCPHQGRLYTWYAAMGYGCVEDYTCTMPPVPMGTIQGVCPDGWHMPLKSEFEELIAYVGGEETAGDMLKTFDGWKTYGYNGSDAYGFSAYPVGWYDFGAGSFGDGSGTRFWTSEEYGIDAYALVLSYSTQNVTYEHFYKNYGFSIRCVKGKATGTFVESSSSSTTKSSSSESVAFSSSSIVYETLEDSRDGKIYKAVKIGGQTWMAENLNYKVDSSFCYNDSAEYCEKYGRFYTWAAAMDSVGAWSVNGKGCGTGKMCSPTYPVRGVCPEGWHLPTETEWKALFIAVGDTSMTGKALKSTSGWTDSGNGTDSFGLSMFPAGNMTVSGNFVIEGYFAVFCSSTEVDDDYAYVMSLDHDNAHLHASYKNAAFSVRCLKD
jgi:uncharacterized protein (TIGR02145 family)